MKIPYVLRTMHCFPGYTRYNGQRPVRYNWHYLVKLRARAEHENSIL